MQLAFMQSDGGLAPADDFSGFRAILSGPAGGYVGFAETTKAPELQQRGGRAAPVGVDGVEAPAGLQVIGFDMGGTSTDVSRYAGTFEHVFEASIAGVTVQVRAGGLKLRHLASWLRMSNVEALYGRAWLARQLD